MGGTVLQGHLRGKWIATMGAAWSRNGNQSIPTGSAHKGNRVIPQGGVAMSAGGRENEVKKFAKKRHGGKRRRYSHQLLMHEGEIAIMLTYPLLDHVGKGPSEIRGRRENELV